MNSQLAFALQSFSTSQGTDQTGATTHNYYTHDDEVPLHITRHATHIYPPRVTTDGCPAPGQHALCGISARHRRSDPVRSRSHRCSLADDRTAARLHEHLCVGKLCCELFQTHFASNCVHSLSSSTSSVDERTSTGTQPPYDQTVSSSQTDSHPTPSPK